MSEVIVENKQVVVPGQILANGMDYLPGPGAYRQGDSIIANRLGLVSIDGRAIKLIPLAGRYNPKRDDTIVGRVEDILMSGWRISTNTAYSSVLNVKEASDEFIDRGEDLSKILALDDYIACKITSVSSQKLIDVSIRGPGLGKLPAGTIMKVNAQKVPRIIGKAGSMVSMIKEHTGCNVIVGQNGMIWLSGSSAGEVIARETIFMIEKFSHISGLTDLIKAYLEKECAGKELPEAKPLSIGSRAPRQNGGFAPRRNFNHSSGRPPRRFSNRTSSPRPGGDRHE